MVEPRGAKGERSAPSLGAQGRITQLPGKMCLEDSGGPLESF